MSYPVWCEGCGTHQYGSSKKGFRLAKEPCASCRAIGFLTRKPSEATILRWARREAYKTGASIDAQETIADLLNTVQSHLDVITDEFDNLAAEGYEEETKRELRQSRWFVRVFGKYIRTGKLLP